MSVTSPAVVPARARVPGAVNYPQNLWWVAATSAEVGRERLLARRLLDRAVVLFRREDGSVAALEDRCPHRGTPLSMGWLERDELVCGYHGFRFATDGRCTGIPTQAEIPRQACVRSFPVVDRPPFVWIWMGDPARAEAASAPYYPWLNDPGWVYALDRIHIESNYLLLKENVLDLTHFAYAHRSTFEMDDDYDRPPDCKVEDGRVTFSQEFLGKPLPPFYGDHCGLGRKPVDRHDAGTSFSPAEHVFTARIVNRDPAPGERAEYFVKFHHMTTPETPRSHHYWWIMARDHGLGADAEAWMRMVITAGFAEDKVILEAIQRRRDEAGADESQVEISVAADRAGLQARRQAKALIERERAPGAHKE